MNTRQSARGRESSCALSSASPRSAIGTIPVDAFDSGVRSTQSPLLATGHAEVMAQGIVSLGHGAYHWAVVYEPWVAGADD